MKKIAYNDASQTLRLEFPDTWDAESISGVAIEIQDTGASSLLASTAATLYTATTLGAAASSGDSTITLTALADNVTQGDRLRLANPREDVEVVSYDTSTKVATLAHSLYRDHADASAVTPLWATYSLDTSNTSTFALGDEIVIIWTAAGIDNATRYQLRQIADRTYESSDFTRRFALRYPSEALAAGDQLVDLANEATDEIGRLLGLRGLDIDKVIDADLLDPLIMAYARWMVSSQGGDNARYEREIAWEDYLRLEQALMSSPIWDDRDLDGAEDSDEVDDHVWQTFERAF